MAALDEAVRAALSKVDEPELRRSVTDLGMVDQVAVDGRKVRVTLALPLPGDDTRAELRRRALEALASVPGVDRVDVDLRDMDETELRAVAGILKGITPNPLQVLDAAHAGAQRSPEPRPNPFVDTRTRVLAIASGKGGVGKSSVTTNLSIALAGHGKRVAAVDADVWGFSMPRMLGIASPPGLIDDVIVPPERYGVRLISMGFFAREDQAVVWRGPMLHKALEQFLTDVYWGDTDYLVIDMPPGTGDVSISLGQLLPRAEAVIVTTPQPLAQEVASRAATMAQKTNMRLIGVIENMTSEIFGTGGGDRLAEQIGIPLLGRVHLDTRLRECGDEGEPIVFAEPESATAQAIVAIAEAIHAARQTFKPLTVLSG
jgi:ATP-binding protein involved in chromosome partitioning